MLPILFRRLLPRLPLLCLASAVVLSTLPLRAQDASDFVAPGDNLVVENIPPISRKLVDAVAAYTEFAPRDFVAWHPNKREMLVAMRAGNTLQLHRLAEPGAKPEQITDFKEPVRSARYEPTRGEYIVFAKDSGGDEAFQLYRMDLPSKAVTPLSDPQRRAGNVAFMLDGSRIAYTTVTLDRYQPGRVTSEIRLQNPLKPSDSRVLARFDNGRVSGLSFSPDGKTLLFSEFFESDNTKLWRLEIATGKRTAMAPAKDEDGGHSDASFSSSGKEVWTASNRASEWKRLTRIDTATGKRTSFLSDLAWDVERVAMPNATKKSGRPIAFATNEAGASVLRLFDEAALTELAKPDLKKLGNGVMGSIAWHPIADEIAFTFANARSPGEVYSWNRATGELAQWTRPDSPLDTSQFSAPSLVEWKSFDGEVITGFYYRPPAKFTGKRPVFVSIHGGPQSQSRPGFIGRNNYFLNELGVAVIYPNVRGSSGFGKRFLKLDDGFKREDSVKDIGALFDWIKSQPELDADRVLVTGGSYGGYMSFAVSFHYSDRIAGAISSVGISHFATFLKNTESYRRENRRREYGDERDSKMAAFLEKIAPLNNAEKVKKPLFVIQGRNDPRVPYTEALQMVERVRKGGTPVWFLMANDEGHVFSKRRNLDFRFYASVEFVKKTLLPEAPKGDAKADPKG